MKHISAQKNNGFALLLTLVVISVLLSIGLSLLDITLKQILISGTARDSEIAFHAAYAGIECGEYWARDDYTRFIGAVPTLASCIKDNVSGNAISISDSDVHGSAYEITWGPDNNRCTELDVYIMDASSAAVTYTFDNYKSVTCSAGSACTYVFSRGYNRACTSIGTQGTIQREVVSHF